MTNLEFQIDDPNKRDYSPTNLGTWSSASDVNTFLSRFNHNSNYKDGDTKLKLGNYVTIQDGTYNVEWMIAGFDMEHNQIAADNTTFDNGYGICMIPKIHVTGAGSTWNNDDTVYGAYKSSTMHTTHLPGIVSKLQNVLGSHIVNRNVLLSSSAHSSYYYSTAYTWTTAYATLMSAGQLTGDFAANSNKYDDGEANYKLPIFNSTGFKTASWFWLRGLCGYYNNKYRNAYYVNSSGDIVGNSNASVTRANGVRPLIYLR